MLLLGAMGMRALAGQIRISLALAGGGVALALLIAGAGLSACARKAVPTLTANEPPPSPPAAAADEQADPHEHGAGKRTKFRETAVYVDGKVVSVMRCSELPPTMAPRAMRQINSLDTPRFYRLYDYVTALGVDVAKLRSIQLYGTHSRVATITGEELSKYRSELVFDYTQQVTGKPRARWSTHGLKNPTYIDMIFTVAMYVDKPAPVFNPHTGLTFEDGTPVDGVPYVSEDAPKGTRVYVDGLLQGWVKRKMLGDGLIAKDSDRVFPKFSFAAFLQSLGVDAKRAKAVDFVSNDELVARVDARELSADRDTYVFTTPRHAHGKVKGIFPGDKTAGISSVQLFIRTNPPTRSVDPTAFDPKDGSDDQRGDGEAKGGHDGTNSDGQDDE